MTTPHGDHPPLPADTPLSPDDSIRYPPPGHWLRWLRIGLDTREADLVTGWMPVLDDLLDHTGGARLGPLATFADFVAGVLSVRVAAPSWVATQDLQLHLTGHPRAGRLSSVSRITRAGRTSIVSETEIRDTSGALVALAIITYAVLSRQPTEAVAHPSELRDYTDPPGVELPRQPVSSLLGFELDASGPIDATTITFGHPPVLRNSTGAIQGGVLATAMDELATALAERTFGVPARSSFLHLNYLAAGRKPPFQVRGHVLATDGDDVLCRIEIVEVPTERRLAQGLVRASATR